MFTKKLFFASLTILSIFFAAQLEGAITNYGNCDKNAIGNITELKVGNCTSQPCTLKRNNAYIFSTTFTPNTYTTSLNSTTTLTLNTVAYPPANDPNGCASLTNGTCPAEANASLTFSFNYTIPALAPTGNYDIKVQLDNQDVRLLCYNLTLVIPLF